MTTTVSMKSKVMIAELVVILVFRAFLTGTAVPPESEYRGVSAAVPQPASEDGIQRLQGYRAGLTLYNYEGANILYRDPTNNQDINEAVYRWDERPYTQIFRTGFAPRDQGETSSEDYYNLERHVNEGGAPGDTTPATSSVFVSTTRSASFRPWLTTDTIFYRYEIFAPGGIDTVLFLGARNNYPNQQEIAFAGGINRQFIRTARAYNVTAPPPGQRYATFTPSNNRIYRNSYFDPNPNEDGETTIDFLRGLRNVYCPRSSEFLINLVYINLAYHRRPRSQDNDDDTTPTEEPYDDPECMVPNYIDCAFNYNNDRVQAFLVIADQCLLMNYAPGSTDDYILKGPMNIGYFFPSLMDTIFASGIDAAFTSSSQDEVYMFRNNLYVLLNFASGALIGGPKNITEGFYSLRNTIFEHGIDAAFASHRNNEAYLFKGDQYALINFAPGTTDDYLLNPPQKITAGFPSLEGSVFADGLDAAFMAEATNEAYIFSDDTYALINYAPGTTGDYIINQVTPIRDGFHSLNGIVPRYP